ncbi:metallo-beta-lactamase domain-containing protein 1 [Galendromus occidentalis]|uniref:Metallo-beta-lactamase domain-containing protein 1 n=1 Tax=Galendromus occidentalis TaxID=34638 RepID=A0AAJ6W041_9ACAR|nr:metallo-beta-lactamase domain-containing protein 1 [Galendromus occidentalis]
MAPVKVEVLFDGFSRLEAGNQFMSSNCTCTLVVGETVKMIVDTMTAWDGDRIKEALDSRGISPDEITHAVATHGHSDHIGNLNLFLNAKHVVGTSMNYKDNYYDVLLDGSSLRVAEGIEIVPTPGHTASCVSVIVSNTESGTIAITGDLFEKREDSADPTIWEELGGSEKPLKQAENRVKVLRIADYVVPGHGPMFKVTEDIREKNHAHMMELRRHYRNVGESDESEKE